MVSKSTKRISLEDVATVAQVSRSTVSLALSKGEGPIPLSEDSIRRVREAARALGYKPNVFARGLASGRSRLRALAVVLPNEQILEGTVNAQVLTGLSTTATQHQYICSLLVPQSNPGQVLAEHPVFTEHLVEGIVAFAWEKASQDENLLKIQDHNLPFVALHMEVEGDNVASVNIDDYGNGRCAAHHLLDCGYRDFLFVGGPELGDPVRSRLVGVKACLEENRYMLSDTKVLLGDYYQVDRDRFMKLLQQAQRPVGIVAISDRLAMAMVSWVKEAGLRIPDEVGIVGFDDEPYAAYLDPALTTIRQDGFKQGKTAAQMILEAISERKPLNHRVVIPGELVVRASTKRVT